MDNTKCRKIQYKAKGMEVILEFPECAYDSDNIRQEIRTILMSELKEQIGEIQ